MRHSRARETVPTPEVSLRDDQGLTASEAASRLRQYGPNTLPRPLPKPILLQLAAQMFHFFAVMLWLAGGLAVLAGMPQLGVAIFVVIILNGVFAFIQEYRAEHAAERLREMLPRKTIVLRDGAPVEISADDLVVGDIVLLQSGDRISADMYLIEIHNCTIDTSALTGESVPFLAEQGETAFAGTFVVEGEAKGRSDGNRDVYAIGTHHAANTRRGSPAKPACDGTPSRGACHCCCGDVDRTDFLRNCHVDRHPVYTGISVCHRRDRCIGP